MTDHRARIDFARFGVRDTITIANPAVATDWSWVAAANDFEGSRILITWIRFTFTADANVIGRRVIVLFQDQGFNVGISPSDRNHTANQAWDYYCQLWGTKSYQGNIGNKMYLPMSEYWFLDYPTGGPGFSVSSQVGNMQAGDQFTSIRITYMKWSLY